MQRAAKERSSTALVLGLIAALLASALAPARASASTRCLSKTRVWASRAETASRVRADDPQAEERDRVAASGTTTSRRCVFTTQTDANSHITRFDYDAMGRRTKRTLPLGMSETMTYFPNGALHTRTDFNGKTTVYGYDPNNNWLASKTPDPTLGEPQITFTYTPTGQRETMTDAHGVTTYGYDLRNRLQTKQTPEGTLTYTYENGNLASVTSSNAEGVSVSYQYDTLNRLEHVVDHRQADATTTYSFDDAGNLATVALPNGISTGYTYNTLNRLTNVTSRRGATTIASYTYTLGNAGNRTKVEELGGRTVGYTYDDIYRLTSETISADAHGNNGTIGYGFDDVGNRLSRTSTVAAVPSTTSTYDLNDRLTTDGYNANGETIASNGNLYQYDFEGRLVALNPGTAGEVRFAYDGDGNRVAKTENGVTTSYLVDTMNPTGYAQVVEEIQNGAVTRRYTYGLDLISQTQLIGGSWTTSYYLYDGHGNVRALTDSAGSLTDTYDYDAFGSLIHQAGATPNSYLYTGEQFDPALGFYYLRARYMNPASGRFWSMDSFEGSARDPKSLHKYLYANADPANRIDPSGYMSLAEIETVFTEMATLSQHTLRVIRIIDRAYSVVDSINMVWGILQLIHSGDIVNHLTDAIDTVRSGVHFTVSDVLLSLEANLPHVLSQAFLPWSSWLAIHGRSVTGLLIYLPNIGNLPFRTFPTNLRIGRLPVRLALGGTSHPGTIVGAGFLAPGVAGADQHQLVWRMDLHPFHGGHGGITTDQPRDVATWEDPPFHYHVVRPRG